MCNRGSSVGATVPARRRRAVQVGILPFLLVLATAMAQQETKDLTESSLEDLANIQVYSASKHLQSIREAPSSVTVITADEIQKYGYRTLADILRSVRGFYITYDRDYSYLGVRGFERLGDYNNRILLLVDGHRINNNIYEQAMLGTEFPVDVELIDRVEIIRGPSSSLYGNNAFFAVINVIVRRPPQLKRVELSFEPASFDTYKGRASYSGKSKGMDMLLSGTFYNSQGHSLFFPEFNTPVTNNGIVRHGDDDVYQHILATVSSRGFTVQGVFSSREKGVPTAYYGTLFNDPRTRNIDDHQYVDVNYQRSLAEKWELVARTSFDQYRLEAFLAYPSGLPDGSVLVNKASGRGNWWDGELNLNRTLLDKHRLTFGSGVRDNVRQDQSNYTASSNIFVTSHHNSWNWALYAQDEFAITRRLTLSAGFRYDRYYSFGGTTNPRLGLIYHPFRQTNFKALYGTAFRAPDVFENYSAELGFFENNLRLRPETVQGIEGVVEQELGQHCRLSGSVFGNRIEHLITQQTDPSTGLLVFLNSEKAQARGTEIEFAGRSARGLQGTASFSYVDADADNPTDEKLENSPRHMAKVNVIVPVVHNRLFAGLDAQYTGARVTAASNQVGGFPIFNLTLLGHTLGNHADLSGSVYNLLDRSYSDPAAVGFPQNTIQQDGRNFRIKLTVRF
jgi:outer membrane receptor for ferrienterochelin and colicins